MMSTASPHRSAPPVGGATPTNANASPRPTLQMDGLAVTPYDRAAGWLVALLVLVGTTVSMLLIVWFSNRMTQAHQPVPVILDVSGGSERGVIGPGMEIDSPNPNDLAQETDLEEPRLDEVFALVVDTVASQELMITDPSQSEDEVSGGSARSTGTGDAPARGDGDGEPGIPREQRWLIEFDAGSTLESYGAQLDFFDIELGAVGRSDRISYASGFTQPEVRVREGIRADEDRLYFIWTEGALTEADQALVAAAGIESSGLKIVQFYPANTENLLAYQEKLFADERGKAIGEIRRTRFRVRTTDTGYEFYVKSQDDL